MLKKLKENFLAGWKAADETLDGKKHYRLFWSGTLDPEAARLDRPGRATVTDPLNDAPVRVPEIVAETVKKHSDVAAVFVQPFDGVEDYGCLVFEEERAAIEAAKTLIQEAKNLPSAYMNESGYSCFEVQLCLFKGQEMIQELESDGEIILSQTIDNLKNEVVEAEDTSNNFLN